MMLTRCLDYNIHSASLFDMLVEANSMLKSISLSISALYIFKQ